MVRGRPGGRRAGATRPRCRSEVGLVGRVTHADAEVVQGLQDVGVAAQQPGDEHGQQKHDDTQDDGQCDHGATSASSGGLHRPRRTSRYPDPL